MTKNDAGKLRRGDIVHSECPGYLLVYNDSVCLHWVVVGFGVVKCHDRYRRTTRNNFHEFTLGDNCQKCDA